MSKLLKREGAEKGDASAVDAFLDAARQTPVRFEPSGRGRLIFALDATMSRQPTWDLATGLQSQMFETAEALGGLAIQLVYFRGFSECRASSFHTGGRSLAHAMKGIRVAAGRTQLGRVLTHVRDESRTAPVSAVIFIGDALEEQATPLLQRAGELALLGTKAFLFQEGRRPDVKAVFQEIARITGGAYAPFDAHAPDRLAALLAAVAAYSAGGMKALRAVADRSGKPEIAALLAQIR